MADTKNTVKLDVVEGTKTIEVPKFKVSVFHSLLKNIDNFLVCDTFLIWNISKIE